MPIRNGSGYGALLGVSLWAVTTFADAGKRENVFVLGQSATVPAGEEVESAVVIGGDLEVEGKVRGLAGSRSWRLMPPRPTLKFARA